RDAIIRRVTAYLEATPPAIQGQNGDNHTYVVCCRVVRDFGLSDSEALGLLLPWNSRCQPPWTERELEEKIRNARRYGEGGFGTKLDGDRPHQIREADEERPVIRDDGPKPEDSTKQEVDIRELHDQVDVIARQIDLNELDGDIRPAEYSDDALADEFSRRY